MYTESQVDTNLKEFNNYWVTNQYSKVQILSLN